MCYVSTYNIIYFSIALSSSKVNNECHDETEAQHINYDDSELIKDVEFWIIHKNIKINWLKVLRKRLRFSERYTDYRESNESEQGCANAVG